MAKKNLRIDQLNPSTNTITNSDMLATWSDNRTERITIGDLSTFLDDGNDTYVSGGTYSPSGHTIDLGVVNGNPITIDLTGLNSCPSCSGNGGTGTTTTTTGVTTTTITTTTNGVVDCSGPKCCSRWCYERCKTYNVYGGAIEGIEGYPIVDAKTGCKVSTTTDALVAESLKSKQYKVYCCDTRILVNNYLPINHPPETLPSLSGYTKTPIRVFQSVDPTMIYQNEPSRPIKVALSSMSSSYEAYMFNSALTSINTSVNSVVAETSNSSVDASFNVRMVSASTSTISSAADSILHNSSTSGIYGGRSNGIVDSSDSLILGGSNNTISGASRTTILGGSGQTVTQDDTVVVQNLQAKSITLNGSTLATPSGLTTKVINIGDWSMSATTTVLIAHGLSVTEWKTIRSVDVIIRDDTDTVMYPLDFLANSVTGVVAGGKGYINSSDIQLRRVVGAGFDAVAYGTTSYNRGWVTIEYTAD